MGAVLEEAAATYGCDTRTLRTAGGRIRRSAGAEMGRAGAAARGASGSGDWIAEKSKSTSVNPEGNEKSWPFTPSQIKQLIL